MAQQKARHFEAKASRADARDVMREAGMRVLKGTLSVALAASLVPTSRSLAFAEQNETGAPIVMDRPQESQDGGMDTPGEAPLTNAPQSAAGGEADGERQGQEGGATASDGDRQGQDAATGGEEEAVAPPVLFAAAEEGAPTVTVTRVPAGESDPVAVDGDPESGTPASDYTNVAALAVTVTVGEGLELGSGSQVSVTNTPFGGSTGRPATTNFTQEGSTTTYKATVTLSAGTNVVKVTATDNATDAHTTTWTRTIVVDEAAPTVTLDEGSDTALVAATGGDPAIYRSRTMTLTFTDDTDVSNVSVTATRKGKEGAADEAVALSATLEGKVATISFPEDGTYTGLTVSAEDACGNRMADQDVTLTAFTVDTLPAADAISLAVTSPASPDGSQGGRDYYHQDVTLTVTVNADMDDFSADASTLTLGSTTYRKGDATNPLTWTQQEGSWVGTVTVPATSGNGTYDSATVTVYDTAGAANRSAAGASVLAAPAVSFAIDTVAPVVGSATVSQTAASTPTVKEGETEYESGLQVYTSATTVTLALTDAGGLGSATLVDGSERTELLAEGSVGQTSANVAIELARDGDGLTRAMLLEVSDLAGNRRIWSINPEGQVFQGGEEVTPAPSNVSLNNASLYPFALIVDTQAPTIDVPGVSDGAFLPGGAIAVEIAEANFDYLRLLPTPPTGVATLVKQGTTETIASLDVDDFELSQSAAGVFVGEVDVPAEDGTYTLTAQLTDIAGNSSATVTRTFTVDATDPVIDLGFEDGSYSQADAVSATVAVTEANFAADDTTATVSWTPAPGAAPTAEERSAGGWAEDAENPGAYVRTLAATDWAVDTGSADVHTQAITLTGEGDYTVSVTTKDKAGREASATGSLTLDRSKPALSYTWGADAEMGQALPLRDGESIAYVDGARTLTLYAAESNWDPATAAVTATGVRGSQTTTVTGTAWERATNDDGTARVDENGVPLWTSTLSFADDFCYTFAPVTIADKAGNDSDALALGAFAIDTVDPTIGPDQPRPAASGVADGVDYYNTPIAFAIEVQDRNYDPAAAQVVATGASNADAVLPLTAAETSEDGVVTYRATARYGEGSYSEPTVSVADRAGRSARYAAAKPFVVDLTAPTITGVTVNNEPSATGAETGGDRQFFQAPTSVTIQVADNFRLAEGTATVQVLNDPDGVYTVPVTVSSDGRTGSLTVSLADGTTRDEDTEFERDIILSLRDVAGNTRTWSIDRSGTVSDYSGSATANATINGVEGNYPLALVQDVTAPTTALSGVTAGAYYNSTQTVHAQVNEFNFGYLQRYFGDRAVMHVTKYEGDAGRAQSSWDVPASAFTGGGAAWSHDERFEGDGHYVVEMSFDDVAGNAAQVSRIEEFTIDKTAPVLTVTFDNNEVLNGKYYKAGRTATVTVVEHNFDPALIDITTEGAVSGWSTSGDTHTLTIAYATDGDYTLTINGRDLAGNAFATYTEEPFTIDLTAPTITFGGVEDAHAYNGDVMPYITFEDEKNFDANGCQWTLRGYNVSSEAGASYSQSTVATGTGQTVSFANFPNEIGVDDIYVLEANLTDLAGNTAQGSITFSVNRFGSNFMVVNAEDYTTESNRGVMSEAPTIQIIEINVSGVAAGDSSVVVSQGLRPETLTQNETAARTGYTVEDSTDEASGWSRYVYTIASGNFEEEGEYQVVVRSNDSAGNKSQSSDYYEHFDRDAGEVKHAAVNFVIDKTAPLIEGLSIADGEVYEEDGREVSFSIVDNVGYESGDVKVRLSGKGGDEEVELSRKGDGTYTFHVDESSFDPRTVEISVVDWAGNAASSTVSGFRVTTNVIELHLPVILGGVGLVGGAAVGGAAWWRRRKDTDAENPTIR